MRVLLLLAILLMGAPEAIAQYGTIPGSAVTYTSNGSTIGLLQKFVTVTSASRPIDATTADLAGLVGIALATSAAGSPVAVGTYGSWPCVFDGATTAGDYVQASATVAGNCHDAGATFPTSNQVVGRVVTTNAAGGTYLITLYGTEVQPVNTSTVPTGLITFITSGTCPTGWSQVAALNGVALRGTLAANGDVGTSTGSDTATPTVASTSLTAAAQAFTGSAGTVPAQTFTGSSATTSAVSAGTPAGTNGTSATTGNCAATNIAAGTGSTTACKATAPNLTVSAQTFTGSALATHTHTLTATGTNGTVSFTPAGTNGTSAVSGTITMNALATVPSSIKVIFCSKN